MKQKQRITALLTAICMLLMLVPFNAVTVTAVDGNFGGGSGTSDDPYLIEDAADLRAFRDLVNSGRRTICGKLVNDINLNPGITFNSDGSYDGGTPDSWTPIATAASAYNGTFDGNNKTVSGVYINVTTTYQGFFSCTDTKAVVQNLSLENSYIKGGNYTGGLMARNRGEIINCSNDATVVGGNYTGGLAGNNDSTPSTITNCINTGDITSSGSSVGGIAGYCSGTSAVSGCINSGTITGDSEAAGGIVGRNNSQYGNDTASIYDCRNTGIVKAEVRFAGGIVGHNEYRRVENCENTASVTGGENVGGIAGGNYRASAVITNCVNTGSVTAENIYNAGGLVGLNQYATIINSYNTGDVSAPSRQAGGLVGWFTSGSISNCYNIGNVEALQSVGGVVGDMDDGEITNCYYLDTTANTAVGSSSGGSVDAESRTETEMKSADFITILNDTQDPAPWQVDTALLNLNNGYPILSWQNTFAGGSGTSGDPFLITTKEELEAFRDLVNDGNTSICGRLENDIVLNEDFDQTLFTLNEDDTLSYNGGEIPASFEQWEPIAGESDVEYVGTFDGNNKTISGLYFNDNSSENGQRVGLFGFLGEDGKIQNLTLSNSIVRGQIYVGGIVGESSGTFENCTNEADVIATNIHAGGIVASASSNDATITNCHNTGNIKGMAYVGGIAGSCFANVTNCTNTGDVEGSGTYGVGGIIGITTSQYSVTVKGCYNTGNITSTLKGYAYVGGIVGSFPNANARGTIEDCYNTGTVTADPTSSYCSGGLLGGGYGNIYDSFNTGTVIGNTFVGSVGGFVSGNVENCYYLRGSASVGVENASDDAKDEGSFTEMSADDMTGPSALTNMKLDNTVWTAGGETSWEFDGIFEDDETFGTYTGTGYLPQLTVFSGNDHQTLSMTKTDLIQQVDDENGKTYYLIYTAEQLETFRDKVNGGEANANGKLMADIDLNPGYTFDEDGTYIYSDEGEEPEILSWNPIGYYEGSRENLAYTGIFNGNGYTVSGIYINAADDTNQGLFGYLGTDGIVQGLTVSNSYVLADSYVSSIVARNEGTIQNCENNGYVYGYYAGGIAGQNAGDIIECVNTAFIDGTGYNGGIAGYNNSGEISSCYNTGDINGTTTVGGITGSNTSSASITNCYNTGDINSDTSYAGGIAGSNTATIENCYNVGNVDGTSNTGGVAGRRTGLPSTVINCYYLNICGATGQGTEITLAQIEDADNLLANLVEGSGEGVWNTTLSAVGEWEYGKPAVQPVLSYQTVVANAPKYSVTIPETATVGGEAATVSMTGSALLATQEVVVTVDENTDFNLYYGGDTSDDSVAYALYVDGGTTAVTAGDTVLTGGNTAEEQPNSADLNFTATETPKYSGSYSGSITFNVSMQTAS